MKSYIIRFFRFFFPRVNDDFAQIAASAERRHAAIKDLDRRARRLGMSVGVTIFGALLLVWAGNLGAVCLALVAALGWGAMVQLHCDSRSLQVFDLMQKEHEKPPA